MLVYEVIIDNEDIYMKENVIAISNYIFINNVNIYIIKDFLWEI